MVNRSKQTSVVFKGCYISIQSKMTMRFGVPSPLWDSSSVNRGHPERWYLDHLVREWVAFFIVPLLSSRRGIKILENVSSQTYGLWRAPFMFQQTENI